MLRPDLDGVYVAIISSGRPQNVPRLRESVGPATYYTGYGESNAYVQQGAEAALETGALCISRNAALDNAAAHNAPCLQLSDDIKRIRRLMPDESTEIVELSEIVQLMRERLRESIFFNLAGVAPTDNAFFSNVSKPVAFAHFCVGDFILVLPSVPRFDENLSLKEDYDFTLQHIQEYGGVVRSNDVLVSFAHRSNVGGAVAYRTAKREQEAIRLLKSKWGGVIRDNPRRLNEVLLKLPR